MTAANTSKFEIPAMREPDDWNEAGLYQTISTTLPDQDDPLEWRAHLSAQDLPEETVAAKVANFKPYQQQYEKHHGPRPDIWAAYDLPGKPSRKLIIHQALADRIPTLYTVPADTPRPLKLDAKYEPITRRA